MDLTQFPVTWPPVMLRPRIDSRKINSPKIGRRISEFNPYLLSYRRNRPNVYNSAFLLFQSGFVRDAQRVAAFHVPFQKDQAAERIHVQHGGNFFCRRAIWAVPRDHYRHLKL